jgi:hypothetical protein
MAVSTLAFSDRREFPRPSQCVGFDISDMGFTKLLELELSRVTRIGCSGYYGKSPTLRWSGAVNDKVPKARFRSLRFGIEVGRAPTVCAAAQLGR